FISIMMNFFMLINMLPSYLKLCEITSENTPDSRKFLIKRNFLPIWRTIYAGLLLNSPAESPGNQLQIRSSGCILYVDSHSPGCSAARLFSMKKRGRPGGENIS
ncbi:MAG: hypothetical protein LUF34_10620, partial [Lachnospiraceae bacterium]|nr:hypothetical protein [Lachnospiraceae bacterium]